MNDVGWRARRGTRELAEMTPSNYNYYFAEGRQGINGVVVTWVVAIDPPGVRFPLNAVWFFIFVYFYYSLILSKELGPGHVSTRVGPGGGPELTYTEYGR